MIQKQALSPPCTRLYKACCWGLLQPGLPCHDSFAFMCINNYVGPWPHGASWWPRGVKHEQCMRGLRALLHVFAPGCSCLLLTARKKKKKKGSQVRAWFVGHVGIKVASKPLLQLGKNAIYFKRRVDCCGWISEAQHCVLKGWAYRHRPLSPVPS